VKNSLESLSLRVDFNLVKALATLLFGLLIFSFCDARAQGVVATNATVETLIIPKLEFKEADLTAALDFLKQEATRVSGGKAKPNFVITIPKAELETKKVTLNLREIPFLEAVNYICRVAGVQAEIEARAIVIQSLR